MLLYTIKAKTTWDTIKNAFHSPRTQESSRLNYPRCNWSKERYAAWIENVVKTKFKKGDLVTFASCPPMPNVLPFNMEITYLHEMHHYVEYDEQLLEPRAITCRTLASTYEFKCPSTLRLLTKEELDLVNLSNKKAYGNS